MLFFFFVKDIYHFVQNSVFSYYPSVFACSSTGRRQSKWWLVHGIYGEKKNQTRGVACIKLESQVGKRLVAGSIPVGAYTFVFSF